MEPSLLLSAPGAPSIKEREVWREGGEEKGVTEGQEWGRRQRERERDTLIDSLAVFHTISPPPVLLDLHVNVGTCDSVWPHLCV